MTRESLARISAWCIALYAFDVLTPVVDILGLPIPRHVASMTLSTVFIVAALGMHIYLARWQQIHILGGAEIALSGMLIFWSGLEVIGASGRSAMSFDMIFEFLPLLLVLMATRLHLKLFGNASILVSAMVFSAGLMVLAHTVLLLILSIGVQPSIVDSGEVMGRNGMAVLVPVCLWMLAWFPFKHWPAFGHRYNLLILLALTNALLCSARMGLLILAWSVLVGAILHWPPIRRLLRALLIPASLVLMAIVSFSFGAMQVLNEQGVWGGGDDATSVLSRSYSNYLLLDKLTQDPLLGIGWTEVAATRVFGYMGHSLYVNVLAAYGGIGAIAATCVLAYGLLSARRINREVAIHLFFLVILISSFFNNVFEYFGAIVALIGAAKVRDRKRQKNDLKTSLAAC